MSHRCLFAALLVLFASPVRGDEPKVSFANEVGPILVGRCLACHNERVQKGRLSVGSFAALMKGGESGPAVAAGDADFSNLILQVESGEMPKDGDPLPADEIATLKRWVAQGAKLDEGKSADAPLASLIPKPTHPAPPEVYPAPVPATALAFRPDGGLLAVSGYHEVLLFDPADGRLVRRVTNLAERVHGLAFSPDDALLAVAAGTPGRLGEVKLFAVETGDLVADLATAADGFFAVAFSPDGSKLAAGGADRSVRVWTVADRAEVARIEDHADWVVGVAFSPDGGRLATASRDKTAKVFDLAGPETVATFGGHGEPVAAVSFSPDGESVASCGRDKQVRFWKVADAKQIKGVGVGGESLALVRVGGDALLCGGADRKGRVLGFDGGSRKTFAAEPDWIYSVAATADGGLVALGGYDGTVTLRKPESGETVRTLSAMPPRP